ncbi:hypothetical protein FXO37_08386 [Capsicum annuum]|nr:hypothetical protein FXO37_08386 [Capsicum annuum]
MEPTTSTSPTLGNDVTSAIFAHLDTISQYLAMENERLDHMVGQMEHVGCPNTCLDDGRSSCDLQGRKIIPYTPMNLECRDVAINGQKGVVAALPLEEIITSLKLDNELIESALACPKSFRGIEPSLFKYNVLFEDSLNSPNEHSGASDVDGTACLGGYSLYANPLWCDNIPPQDGNLFLEDESTLKGRECGVLERNSQSGEDELELLECLGNPKYYCSCSNVFVFNLFAAHGDLYLWGDYSFERESVACLEILSTSSSCVCYVEHTNDDEPKISKYLKKDTMVKVDLCDTFLYPLCAHDIFHRDIEGMPNFEYDTLGESESGRDLSPWLIHPFDPGTILGWVRITLGLFSFCLDACLSHFL